MLFPSAGMQVLACIIHLLGLTVITHCLSRRFRVLDFMSWEGLAQITWPRGLVILIFLDSWSFVFSSTVVIFGIGLETNGTICSAGIFLCIAFYATSKLLIYTFLSEKVHIVWSPAAGRPRFKSPAYLVCFCALLLYLIIITLMLLGPIHYFREDHACMIGLKTYASIPLLSYDLFINLFLTAMFLWPLTRTQVINSAVKRISIRTLIAACIALTTSTVNIAVLAVMKGSELGWVCLGSCTADVVLNAVAIFWVTQNGKTSALYSASEAPSKAAHAAHHRERNHTEETNTNIKSISMGRFSMSQLRSFDAVRSISPPQSPSQQMLRDLRDIESGRRASRGYRTLRSMTSSVFPSRRGHERTESANLHITVTTECGSEETRFELRPIRMPEYAAFEPP